MHLKILHLKLFLLFSGSRFALLEAKVLIVSLMSRFDIVPVKRTTIPIKLAKTMNLTVKDGFWLGFKKRNK